MFELANIYGGSLWGVLCVYTGANMFRRVEMDAVEEFLEKIKILNFRARQEEEELKFERERRFK